MARPRTPGAPPGLSGEDRLIDWLRQQPTTALVGDDAAVLPKGAWAVTMDTQIAGVHVPVDLDPAWLARRLLAVNLSDLAAMGAEPGFAFVALSTAEGFDHRRFFRALTRSCQAYELQLAGGDLSRHNTTTAVMTLLGKRRRRGAWLSRSAARPGDVLWLGGTVGEASLGLTLLARGARAAGRTITLPDDLDLTKGLATVAKRAVRRQLQPTPQLALSTWLARHQARCAVIDVSDGTARDLHRLCRASGTGATVDAHRLPLAAGNGRLAGVLGLDLTEAALHAGDDYVLLFTLPPGVRPPEELETTPIGRIDHGEAVRVLRDGSERPLASRGWDHLDS